MLKRIGEAGRRPARRVPRVERHVVAVVAPQVAAVAQIAANGGGGPALTVDPRKRAAASIRTRSFLSSGKPGPAGGKGELLPGQGPQIEGRHRTERRVTFAVQGELTWRKRLFAVQGHHALAYA